MFLKKLARPFIALSALILPGFIANTASAEEFQKIDIVEGTGAEAVAGKMIKVHYTGTLLDGTKFDSSVDRGTPFTFTLGAGRVIQGWEQGFSGMKVGGKRKLIIPPEMGYGSRATGKIPANSVLQFDVELLAVKDPFVNIDNAELQKLLDEGVTLVDIRRPDEWKSTGVIEGSKLITAFLGDGRLHPEFPQRFLSTVERDQKVALICRSGNRSKVLSQMLVDQAGFSDIYNVENGIISWSAEKRPLVQPE